MNDEAARWKTARNDARNKCLWSSPQPNDQPLFSPDRAGEPTAHCTTFVDIAEMKSAIRLGGSRYEDVNLTVAVQALGTVSRTGIDPKEFERQQNAVCIALAEMAPRDVVEGQIAAQMIACHNAAMECFRRAALAEQSPQARQDNLNQANKLTRSYATLLEALNRHRGMAQQTVRVDHVHIHAGGQAIVGCVPARGREHNEPGDRSHGKQLTHAPVAPVFGALKADEVEVPSASGSRS